MTHARIAVLCLAATLATAGCAGGTDDRKAADTPSFNAESGAELTCIAHQGRPPGAGYTATGGNADTARILEMLRYYTTHGRKPYCDQQPPTDNDRRWAGLYVELGAARTNVAAILDPR